MQKSRLDDGTVLVAFELPAAVAATSVNLVGDFNGWSTEATPLAQLDDGRFRTELALPPGQRRRFRYLVDGQRWENDWAADAYEPNGLGTEDSVVDLTGVELAGAADRTASAAPVPVDTVPVDTVPVDTVPVDTVPVDTTADAPATAPARRRWWQLRRRA